MSQVPPPPQPFSEQPVGQQPYGQAPYGQPPAGFPPAGPGGAPYGQPPLRRTSVAAMASLICGILGCIPFVTGLLAVVLGIVGIRKTRDPRFSGRGLAIAGLILGLLSVVLWGVFGGGMYGLYVYGKPARLAADQMVRDLSAGNVDAAQANCTASITRDELVAASDKVKAWGAFKETTLPMAFMNKTNGVDTFEVAGFASFGGAQTVPYAAHLVKQSGQLKVDGFVLQHPNTPVAAGTTPKTNVKANTGN